MHFKSIRKTLELLRNGQSTVAELNRNSLCRLKQIEHLNAFISQKIEDDVAENYFPNDRDTLSLNGIPFAIKDNFSSTDFFTTCGSKMLKDYMPPYNATVLQKLLNAGANLIGKTNMDEFAMGSGAVDSVFGPVKNPWTPEILNDSESKHLTDWHISGGSSGGSAVAVATGVAMFALGSDTGGSVRNPASHCGIVGLKPTYGLVSRHGLITLVNSMDVPGIFTRTVEDASMVLNILKGKDVLDSTTVDSSKIDLEKTHKEVCVKGMRVGIPKECLVHGMSSEVVDAWRWAADKFEEAGARVEQVSLPHMKLSIVCYHILGAAEVASNMARFDGLKYGHRSDVKISADAMFAITRKQGLNDTVRSRILAGNYFLLRNNVEKFYRKAQQVRRLIKQDYETVFGKEHILPSDERFPCDILLSPVVVSDAPLHSDYMREDNRTQCAKQDVLTQSANIAGVPAVTVPTCLSVRGLPIGLQITGNHFAENQIFKAASFLEMVSDFPSLEQRFESQTFTMNAHSL